MKGTSTFIWRGVHRPHKPLATTANLRRIEKRNGVWIREDVYERVKAYAKKHGRSICDVVDEAVNRRKYL